MSFLLSHPVFIFVFGGLIILSLTYTLYRLFPSRKTPKYIPSFICLVFEIYLVVHAFPFISRGWEGMGYLMLRIAIFFILLAGFISAKVFEHKQDYS